MPVSIRDPVTRHNYESVISIAAVNGKLAFTATDNSYSIIAVIENAP
jgi:hypothetical protein